MKAFQVVLFVMIALSQPAFAGSPEGGTSAGGPAEVRSPESPAGYPLKHWEGAFSGLWKLTHYYPIQAERCTVSRNFRMSMQVNSDSDTLTGREAEAYRVIDSVLKARGYTVVDENENPEFKINAFLLEEYCQDPGICALWIARVIDGFVGLTYNFGFRGVDENANKIDNRVEWAATGRYVWKKNLKSIAKRIIPYCHTK